MPIIITPDASSSGNQSMQVNSDWDATSGVAQILNKPVIGKPIIMAENEPIDKNTIWFDI